MSEIIFSKKRIEPLIEKFEINPETNKDFRAIIEMFNGMTEYQIWAIKLVFSGVSNLQEIQTVKEWFDKHSTIISKLSKHNLVAYTTSDDMNLLISEMDAFNKILFVKKCISMFNTKQKKLISDAIHINSLDHLHINTNTIFTSWYKAFDKFNKLPFTRKSKFISLCSAFDSASEIKNSISVAVKQSYAWNKEDMLAFRDNNTPDSKIIFNQDNIVVLEIPSFHDSQLLCGGGRTGWCITRQEDYFKNYTESRERDKRKQYFLFNFDKPESDEIAHVGFTVSSINGICYAHSTKNLSLVGGNNIKYHGKNIDVYDILKMANISLSKFIKIEKNSNYEWTKESLCHYLDTIKDAFSVVYDSDSKLIIKLNETRKTGKLIDHTKLSLLDVEIGPQNNAYLIFNFGVNYDDESSIFLVFANVDPYGIETAYRAYNIFHRDVLDGSNLQGVDIKPSDFINNSNIIPEKLLHKYISLSDEENALKVIEDNPDLDVNYILNETAPIVNAINRDLTKVVNAIISSKKFDTNTSDGFGEPILISMIYAYMSCELHDKSNREAIQDMIVSVLENPNVDLNQIDINLDTAINVAIEDKSTMWIAEYLVANKNVNINVINDYDRSALGNAIACGNIQGIKLLATRPDLVVRTSDLALAKQQNIHLEDYIDMRQKGISVENVTLDVDNSDVKKYMKILASTIN